MKRKWLWVWAGVLFLLWMFPPFVCLYPHRPVAEDQAVLGPSEFVFPWRTAAPAASTPPAWSRAGPRESFALHSEFLTTHDRVLLGVVTFWLRVVRLLGRRAA